MNNEDYIDLEKPIIELREKIRQLREISEGGEIDISEEMSRLQSKSEELTKEIFAKLEPEQVVKLARHPRRPYFLDYAELIFEDFVELHGDRAHSDDKAIVGGMAKFNGEPVMLIGQQKGRETKEKVRRNFGMPRPEGYRKAKRLMKLAEKFNLPIFTFIDTPGAYPGIGAEERGQSEAIAANLMLMANLKTPIIVTVIGEGGSGGALAIGVGDKVFMLEHSIYSVISPEGCASILWRSAEHAAEAAEAMQVTAQNIKKLDLIDDIILEPLGGAHRRYEEMSANIKATLESALEEVRSDGLEKMLEKRYQRFRSHGFVTNQA